MSNTYAFVSGFPKADGPIRRVQVYKGVVYISGAFTTLNGLPRIGFGAFDPDSGAVLPFTLLSPPTAVTPVMDFTILNDIIYICGFFTAPRNYAAAYDMTGALLAWDPNLNNYAFCIDTDGVGVFIGGIFTTVNGGTSRPGISKFDTVAGTVLAWDAGIGGAFSQVVGITISGSTLYMAGNFTLVNTIVPRNGFASVDTITATAAAWDPDTNGSGICVEYYAGSVYIGGGFTLVNGGAFSRNALASVDATAGSINSGFDATISGGSAALARIKQRNGILIATGGFQFAGGVEALGFALLDISTGIAIPPEEINVGLANYSSSSGYDAEILGTRFFLGGDFDRFLGNTRRGDLAAYAVGSNILRDLNIRTDGSINKVVAATAGKIYFFGSFSSVTGSNGTFSRTNAAAVDLATSEILPFNPLISGGDVLTAIVIIGLGVFMGGSFNDINGSARNLAGAVDEATGAVTLAWDPNFSGNGNHIDSFKYNGVSLYVGGSFDTVNGATTRHNVCLVDTVAGTVNVAWDPDATGIGETVFGLEYDGTYVYIAGSFDTVGGQPRSALARVSAVGVGAVDLTWIFDTDIGDDIFSIIRDTTGSFYVTGGFTNINGTPQKYLSRITPLAVLDPTWANNLNTDAVAPGLTLGTLPGLIYISGVFNHVDGDFRNGVTNTTPLGTAHLFAPNPYGPVNSFSFIFNPFGMSTAFIAGDFEFVDIKEAYDLLVLDIPPPPPPGLPQAPKIRFLNRRTQKDAAALTMFRWDPVVRDEQNNPTTATMYRIYRSISKNLEDPTLITEITTTDLKDFVDTLFVEEIDGYYKYCVSAVNSVGEGGKSCINFVETQQLERLG